MTAPNKQARHGVPQNDERKTVMKKVVLLIVGLFVLQGCEENDGSLSGDTDVQLEAVAPDCVRYVDPEAEQGGDGLSWETACDDIQVAVDSAEEAAGDEGTCEVWLKEGALELLGENPEPFAVNENVSMYKGFIGEEAVRNGNNRRIFLEAVADNSYQSNSDANRPQLVESGDDLAGSADGLVGVGNVSGVQSFYDSLPQSVIKPSFGITDPTPLASCGAYCSGHLGTSTGWLVATEGAALTKYGFVHTDQHSILNTTLVGECGYTGYACMKNQSLDSSGKNYALLQHSAGETYLNAASTKNINFRINNDNKMRLMSSGRLELISHDDAEPSQNTGYLEIGNSLRIDDNEIITNAGTILHLQADNQTDLYVDWGTLMVDSSANRVGIGTTSPDHKLDVHGTIRAEEIIVEMFTPDYVFGNHYDLWSLEEVETYINENNHLPGIPSASEVNTAGVSLGDAHASLLQKVEELTLHLIEQNKKIVDLQKQIEAKL